MEQNLQILPKKVWSMLRVFYCMLRKGVSKRKLWMDLNMMMKRAKIAGKAFHNLMFHHHHNWASFAANHHRHQNDSRHLSFPPPEDDSSDFSCTASPLLLSPMLHEEQGVEMTAFYSAVASPMVRQLRITDSPFPVSSEDNHVDAEAEQFISRFYNDLKHQNSN